MNKGYGRPVNSYAGVYAVPIFDSTGVIVTVNGITPQNANRYQFRVLEDMKKVILPWSTPKLFTKAYMMTKIAEKDKIDEVTAYLGQFKGNFDKTLTFQVMQIDKPDSIAATFSAYWVKWPPKVLEVFKFSQLPDFLNVFKNQWTAPMEMDNSDWSKDSTLLKLQTEFQYDDNNLIFYLDGIIKSKKIIEYKQIACLHQQGK